MATPEFDRQKTILKVLVIFLVLGAVMIAVVPARVPRPARLMFAATDLVGAAMVYLLLRQKSGGK